MLVAESETAWEIPWNSLDREGLTPKREDLCKRQCFVNEVKRPVAVVAR